MRTPPQVMPAIVTPFDESGDIDVDTHRHNVAVLADRGITGFVVGGSTGEGPYLEPGERAALIAATKDASPDAFVLGGIVAESLREATRLAAEVASAGADAVLAMSPTTLVRGRDHLVAGYYEALADAATLPVFLYTVPGVTGYSMPLEAIAQAASHPNIVGIKDSGGDLDRVSPTVGTGLITLVGASAILGPAIAAGAHGGITASTNYAAPIVLSLAETAAAGGDITDSQATLTTVSRAVEQHGAPGTKYAASKVGLRVGVPRLPLREPDADARAAIDAALRTAGLVEE